MSEDVTLESGHVSKFLQVKFGPCLFVNKGLLAHSCACWFVCYLRLLFPCQCDWVVVADCKASRATNLEGPAFTEMQTRM